MWRHRDTPVALTTGNTHSEAGPSRLCKKQNTKNVVGLEDGCWEDYKQDPAFLKFT